MAPLAPSPWPVAPLMEVTGGESVPNTLPMASDSAWSLSGVEVPWALMWATCAADDAGVVHGQLHAGGGTRTRRGRAR